MGARKAVERVEFRTLKDLFCFVIANSTPGQQILSVTKYGRHTYIVASRGDSDTVFFTNEAPKASVYACDDVYDFSPAEKPSRSKLNILVQDVMQDSLADSLFAEAQEGMKTKA
jgi:formylmethanofuran dehydrogenase subunit E